MSTAQDFDNGWAAAEPAPVGSGTVRGICVRVEEGVHTTPQRVEVTVEDGLAGDRWSTGRRDRDAQVTLMNVRVAELIGGPLDLAGDNFQVDLDLSEEASRSAHGSRSDRPCSRSRRLRTRGARSSVSASASTRSRG